MAKSFYLPEAQPRIEDFTLGDYYHPASDRHYGMREKDGGLFQYRYQLDADGHRYNEVEVQVDAIMGSGNHVRSYLYQTESGELFQLPLAWYSKAKVWRMNPGYDNAFHLGFQRKINRECMFCHNAYPLDVEPGSDQYWQPDVFPKVAHLPHGIGCQRCHGPGQRHIELANGDATSQEVLDSIVNPSDLPSGLRDDVCFQCHLQPSSQILSELVRVDRTDYSFRPGEPLNHYRALLDYTGEQDSQQGRFEINHHAYRLNQSACVDDSGRSLSCVACHDPHRKIAPAQRLAHFRDACLQCHEVTHCGNATEIESPRDLASHSSASLASASPETQLADCVQCHMPSRRTQDVVHAVMTDHRIVAQAAVKSKRLGVLSEPPPPPQDTEPFPYREPRGDGESGSESLDDSESSDAYESLDVYEAIAGSQLGNASELRRLIQYVRDRGDEVELMPLAELADALRKFGDESTSLQVVTKAVQLYPNHVRTHLEMGMSLAAAGDHETAYLYYRRALDIGPPLPETYVGLGMTLLQRNDLSGAAKHFREAVRLRPLYPEALLNLGIALFAQQQWAEAEEYLTRAVAADPSFVEANEYLSRIPPHN